MAFSLRIRRGAWVLCLAAALCAVAPAAGQSLFWTDISGPRGFEAMYELADGTLFAIDGGVLFRSLDAGGSWQAIPRPGGPILEFAARGSTTVIAIQANAANFKQYFISTNRGNTWTRFVTEGVPIHRNLMLAPDGTPYALIVEGSRMAVDRFTGGAWQRLGVPSNILGSNNATFPPNYTVSAIDESGAVYIGTTADGIHSTRNNAQSWTRTLSYFRVDHIAFSPGGRVAIATRPNGRTAGGVFTSDDHGLTWNVAGFTDFYFRGASYNRHGDLLVLAGRGIFSGPVGVYRNDSASAAWDSAGGFNAEYALLHVSVGGSYLLSEPEHGNAVSTDDGVTWKTDGVRFEDLYALGVTERGTLLAGTVGRGVYRSTTGGEEWSRMEGGPDPAYFYSLLTIDTITYAGTEKGLYRSIDDGMSWTSMTSGLNPESEALPVYGAVIGPLGRLFIATEAGVFRSATVPAGWEPSGLGSSSIRALAVDGAGSLYAATGSDGVFASYDGGDTWLGMGLVRSDLQTIAVNAGRIFVGAASGIFVSTDGGAGWERRVFTYGHVQSFLFNGNFQVYAGSSYGLFVSDDAGNTWASAGLDGNFVVGLAYDASHAMLAAVYQTGVMRTFQPITGVGDPAGLPVQASLSQNYPNPFNPVTTIEYSVPSPASVTLRVYDLLGRVSETPVAGAHPPGMYTATWDAGEHPSGVYFYSLEVVPLEGGRDRSKAFTQVRKMLLVR